MLTPANYVWPVVNLHTAMKNELDEACLSDISGVVPKATKIVLSLLRLLYGTIHTLAVMR